MIECRAAAIGDYPAAAALRREMSLAWGEDFDLRARDWRAKFCEYFGGKQTEGNAQLFLAYDNGTPIGCAIFSVLDDYRRNCFGMVTAHVNAVFVRERYRRRGIGRRLMELGIAWAKDRGCARVRLRASDEGRSLYERLGFHPGREMELDL